MAKTKAYERIPWEDRFNQPTLPGLRRGLRHPAARLFDAARRLLVEFEPIREEVVWHGDCWRWTIEYHTSGSEGPLAVIVPSPVDLQLAVPLDPEFISSLPLRRMKRAVRDGLDLAAEPFDTRWGVWSLQSQSLLTDLQDLIQRKVKHQARRAG